MVSNNDVAKAWRKGKKLKSAGMYSDGNNLYSYALKIGKTVSGKKVAIDYTASGGQYWSQSTSKHVAYAKRNAHRTVKPPKR